MEALPFKRSDAFAVQSAMHNLSMPSPKTPPPIYQLKVTLIGIEPPIWRRIQVPSTILLRSLHDVIQIAVGWTDSHSHEFEDDGKSQDDPKLDNFDETKVSVGAVLKTVGDSVIYLYDFGDNWRHRVMLSKILLTDETSAMPTCIGGERRCPPEDVGGVNGYDELMEAIFDPDPRKSYEEFRSWTGDRYHPDEFDLKIVNDQISRMGRQIRHSDEVA
ncbi:MAG: plasmid pRiA4b ORF-3 family protein [Bryobacteraceae bacterium]